MQPARGVDFGLETQALDVRDGLALEVAPVGGLESVAVINQHRFDRAHAGGPQHDRRRVDRGHCACGRCGRGDGHGSGRFHGEWAQKPARADVRLTAADRREDFGGGIDRDEAKPQLFLDREHARKVGLDSDHAAVRAGEVVDRSRPDDDDEIASRFGRTDHRPRPLGKDVRVLHHQQRGDERNDEGGENVGQAAHRTRIRWRRARQPGPRPIIAITEFAASAGSGASRNGTAGSMECAWRGAKACGFHAACRKSVYRR